MQILMMSVVVSFLLMQQAQASNVKAGVLLRYENETNQINIAPRKRLRAIATLDFNSMINKTWAINAQVSTGLKNKQNVPAITLHQFTEQSAGDKDIYLSRLYAQAKMGKMSFLVGKIPWKTDQVTDLFWDRHLNPLGFQVNYELGAGKKIKFATFKPLDGAKSTIGHMSILQYQTSLTTDFGTLTLMPWLVDYKGEANAEFAKKDTQFDNQFVRFSGAIKQGKWQFGTDIGWSIKGAPDEYKESFSEQRLSYALELKHGGLKNVGSYLTQLKYLYVERFSVVTEFAQNASSRFATSNFKGWDFRIRHKLTKNLWVGGRLSRTQRLLGIPEQGVRFRLETKYSF